MKRNAERKEEERGIKRRREEEGGGKVMVGGIERKRPRKKRRIEWSEITCTRKVAVTIKRKMKTEATWEVKDKKKNNG